MLWFITVGLFSGEELNMFDVTQKGVIADQMADSIFEQFNAHGYDVLYVFIN